MNNSFEALYNSIKGLPILSPHGHTDPSWFANNENFSDPAELLIIPDHYVFRMLYSQGFDLKDLGIGVPKEQRDSRSIFKLFASNIDIFLGTPSLGWLTYVFKNIFGLEDALNSDNADYYYDIIDAALKQPEFKPRAILGRFNIELLATTDAATDDLAHHKTFAKLGHSTSLVPTFRPDSVLNPNLPEFKSQLNILADQTNENLAIYDGYLNALQKRRQFFKTMGATATDHDIPDLATCWLERHEIEALFSKILQGVFSSDEANIFYNHMLVEMAQMSVDDGLVMQLHAGNRRSTNQALLEKFGRDMGADIPHAIDWVHGLNVLLNRCGNDENFSLIAFTLDESTYSRELAPMAGHWPALRLGPPWWFNDSPNGIARYFDSVVETAGYFNLTGFNDDTRALLSIPARHDMWRRAVALHLSKQIEAQRFGLNDALHLAHNLTSNLVKTAYKLK